MNRLLYFPVPGRGEASRVALALSELEWEDVEVNGEVFNQMRTNGELPWDMLPVLQTPEAHETYPLQMQMIAFLLPYQ